MELHNVTTTTAISISSSPEPPGEEFGKESFDHHHRFSEDFDSNCSTPYVSAPSSPGRAHGGYFFSAPTSPMHFMLSSSSNISKSSSLDHSGGSFEFDFSARFSSSSNSAGAAGSMISADELFLNGQIRPTMKLSSHLQRPQVLAPLLDLEGEGEGEEDPEADTKDSFRGRDLRLRNRSLHRRARSLSPLRNSPWRRPAEEESWESNNDNDIEIDVKTALPESSTETTPASSRSSSSGSRSSKSWEFLKDFLRSKSEGRANTKDKFWNSLSFSPIKDKRTACSSSSSPSVTKEKKHQMKSKSNQSVSGKSKPANGVSKRRVPQSAHEIHYTTKRAQAEEMKKKTFLPYRQGLLGCLGFSSKGYGAMNGFARSLNPVSSR